jgi:predicted DNA-binding transcriptional regulator AlpA
MTSETPDAELTTTDVLKRLHLRESSRYGWLRRAIRDGKFPPADYQQRGRGQQNRWKLSTIEAWEKQRSLGSKQPELDFAALEQREAEAVWQWAEVLALFQISSATLCRWLSLGWFPKPDVQKLSMKQVAARFQTSPSQIRRWEAEGSLQPNRLAGVPMYGAKELRQLYQMMPVRPQFKTHPPALRRFTTGCFWAAQTLEKWVLDDACWSRIAHLERTTVLAKLSAKSQST